MDGAQTLFDDFEIEGRWWLPQREGRKVPGTLRHTKDGIDLRLFSTLYLDDKTLDDKRPPVILGESFDSRMITLVDSEEIAGPVFEASERSRSMYATRLLFVGLHMLEPTSTLFDSASVRYTQLAGWMCPKWPSEEHTFDEHRLSELHIHMEPAPSVFVSVPSLDATVALVGSYVEPTNTYGVTTELSVRYEPFVKIIPNQPQGLSWFNKVTRDCQNLLSLIIGQTVLPLHISLIAHGETVDDSPIPRRVEAFYGSPIFGHHDPMDASPDYLISFRDIESEIGEVMERWFANIEERREVFDLYFGSYYSPDTYLKYQFLGQIQALEGYLRDERGGVFLEPENYHSLREAIKGIVPAGASEEFRQVLMSSVGFANQYPLKKRMQAELDSWPHDLKKYVALRTNFVKTVVDNRNYFTHYGEKPKFLLEDSNLRLAFERLRIFFMVLLLKDLGMSDERIISCFAQHFRTDRIFQWRAGWLL